MNKIPPPYKHKLVQIRLEAESLSWRIKRGKIVLYYLMPILRWHQVMDLLFLFFFNHHQQLSKTSLFVEPVPLTFAEPEDGSDQFFDFR